MDGFDLDSSSASSSSPLSPFNPLLGGIGVSSRALVRVDAKNVGGVEFGVV